MSKPGPNYKSASRQSGASLIEVVVTAFIFAIGLLGYAALQNRTLKAELESYQYVEAMLHLEWIAHQIRSNRDAAGCYGLVDTDFVGTGYSDTYSCSSYGTAVTQAQAVDDINQWDDLLKGSGETLNGQASGGLINARGCISFDGTDTFEIAVVWQGLVESSALTQTNCAADQYADADGNTAGNLTLRAAVYTVILPDFEG